MEELTVTYDEPLADAPAKPVSSSKQYLDDVLNRLQTILVSDSHSQAEGQLAATRAMLADFITGCVQIYFLHDTAGAAGTAANLRLAVPPPQPVAVHSAWSFTGIGAAASADTPDTIAIAPQRPAQAAFSARPGTDRAVFERTNDLTEREKEVLHWIAEGKTSREVGMILLIAERTVKFHLRNIYSKMNVLNRIQAVTIASRLKQA